MANIIYDFETFNKDLSKSPKHHHNLQSHINNKEIQFKPGIIENKTQEANDLPNVLSVF